jgi:hypothetical protein
MAVAKVFPPAGKRVIVKARRQRLIGGQNCDGFSEQASNRPP